MKINFTKKEYATLVEMLLIADWIIHAHETEPTGETNSYADVRKKVLSHYKEMGMDDAFRYSQEDDEYYETAEYEANSPHMAFIEAYEESNFWDTLANKLAQRELAAEEALSIAEPLTPEQRAMKLWEIQDRYEDELVEPGLDNLAIKMQKGVH